jgi:hypothetical protein
MVERPLVKVVMADQNPQRSADQAGLQVQPNNVPLPAGIGFEGLTDAQLEKLAALPQNQAQLSPESERLVRAKMASIPQQHLSGALVDVQQRALADLARLTALDTARNEYDFHRRIHSWLAAGQNADVRQLNDRIYAELFLTPLVDPWMGLLNVENYSAINAYGVVESR